MKRLHQRLVWTLAIVPFFAIAVNAWAGAPTINLLRVPEGGLQPQAVVDSGGSLHLVFLKGDPKASDIFYTRREPGGATFSAPMRVNSEPGTAVAMGTVRGAQLALGRNGRLHVVWNGAAPQGKGSGMLYARLNDARNGFEPQRNLMATTIHLDGGGSVAADGEGNVYVVWHALPKGEPQDESHRAVFVAKSNDDGKTFASEKRANEAVSGACSCCGLKAFVDSKGRLAVLYRSATTAGQRDVTLLVSTNQGKTFETKVLGPWRLDKCPMSTMALGRGLGDTLVAMWETEGQVFYASLNPERLQADASGLGPEGSNRQRKHPAFAVSDKPGPGMLLAWTEGTAWGKGGTLAYEYVDAAQGQKHPGSEEGVPVWSRIAAVTEADGAFTIIY